LLLIYRCLIKDNLSTTASGGPPLLSRRGAEIVSVISHQISSNIFQFENPHLIGNGGAGIMTLKHFFIIISISLFQLPEAHGEAIDNQKRYTILGLGDSITEGGESFSSYIYPLWEKLFAGGYLIDFIGPKVQQCRIGELSHAGYGGKTIEDLYLMIDSLYRAYPADIVLIHAGHNHYADAKPVNGMISAYKSVIRKVKAINPDVIILIAKVIPGGKLPKYSYIPELNEEIGRMVIEMKDPNVVCVDQATGFDWTKHTVEDRVHPNNSGTERMATVWYNSLSGILPRPQQSFHPEIVPYKAIGEDTLKMHVFKPVDWKATHKRPVIVYFFGGGWTLGTPLQFYRECIYYASKGMIAVTVDYRIKYLHGTRPEDSLEDARDAVCWLRTHADEWGIDTHRIAASGASAGGYLAAAMGVEPGNQTKCYRPDLLILNYAAVGRIDEIGDKIPPVLFLVGSEDPLVPLSMVDAFAEKIKERNGSFELHVFEKAGHPIFYYRKDMDEKFYQIRELTDTFLMKYGYLKK